MRHAEVWTVDFHSFSIFQESRNEPGRKRQYLRFQSPTEKPDFPCHDCTIAYLLYVCVANSQCDATRTPRAVLHVPAVMVRFARCEKSSSLPSTCWSPLRSSSAPVASAPSPLSTDHDPLFRFHRWRTKLRVREIEEVKSVPYAPVSHPFVERLIGTIRREYLDRVFFWDAVDLALKLEAFRDYYNDHRVHRALAGLTPPQFAGALSPAPAALDHYGWQQHCRGLFEIPIAA
jgi:transposase InsO family protein